MDFERRSNERLVLTRQPAGTLTLMTDRYCSHVHRISDVSPAGIAVELPVFDETETAVVLQYVEGTVDLKVLGQVIWREPVAKLQLGGAGGLVRVGVELFSPRLLLHVLPVAWQPLSVEAPDTQERRLG